MNPTLDRNRRYGVLLIFLTLAVLVAGLPVAVQAQAQEGPIRIAVVDLEWVVAKSPGGQSLQARLDQFRQDVRTEADQKTTAANDIRRRMVEGANSLSEDRLAELQKEFEDQQIAIRRFQDDKQREGQKMQTEGLAEIERQLQPVFETIRDESNYDLILNNVPGVVVMAGDRVNITSRVLELLIGSASE